METPRLASAARALRHVFVRDLVLMASIGVHPAERTAPQRIRINLDLAVEDDALRPLSRAPVARTVGREDLTRVVDYEKLVNQARAIVATGHVLLVETLAERVAEAMLADPRVESARVRVEKLDVFADATSAGVEIERRRADLSTR